MTSSITRPFTTSSNYTKSDNNKIQVVDGNGKLMLVDNIEQEFLQDFSSDVGFIYDSDKIEFNGGKMLTKAASPDNATFGITYTTDEHINWSDGSTLTGVLVNGATVSGEQLDLTGGTTKQVTYTPTGTINPNLGTIKFKYTPNYTGNPSSTVELFKFQESSSVNHNMVRFFHDSASAFRMDSRSNSGSSTVVNQPFGTKYLVSGTTYEIEISWNFTSGSEAQRIFIDGTQQGNTATRSTVKDDNNTNITYLQFGDGTHSDNYLEDVAVFDNIQHTSNYTAGYTLSELRYHASDATILPTFTMDGAPDGVIQSVDDFTVTGTINPNDFQFTFGTATQGQFYWDGLAFVSSNETYAQSSNVEDLINNLPSFIFPEGEKDIIVKVYIPALNVQADLDNIDVEYTDQIYSTSADKWLMFNATTAGSELLSFSESITTPVNTSVVYAIEIDGSDFYVTGGVLTASTNSTETNTAAEIETNKALFLTGRSDFRIKAYLLTSDGLSTPLIDSFTFTYDAALAPVTITQIDVNGFFYRGDNPDTSVTLKFRPYRKGFINEGVVYVYSWKDFDNATDAEGFASQDIPKNPANTFWEIKLGKQTAKFSLEDIVGTTVDFADLDITFIEAE